MREFALAGMLLLSSACSGETDPRDLRPPVELVDRIERQFAANPCIGSLSGWERHGRVGGTQ
jgi:hypothetical protein